MRGVLELMRSKSVYVDKDVLAMKFGAALVALWAHFPPALLTLLLMMLLDLLTGLSAAGARGEINSRRMAEGSFRKFTISLGAFACFVVSQWIPPVQFGSWSLDANLGSAFCGAFILSEFTSILENIGRAGVRLPQPIQKILAQLRHISGDEPTGPNAA